MYNLNYPPSVQWEVTSECNHNCIHCYNYWRKDSEKNVCKEKFNTEEKYLELAKKIANNKPVSVVITGGEPLLAFSRIKPAIEYLLSQKISVSINTNSALVTDEIISFLKEKRIGLFISFPCCDEEICNKITNNSNSFKNITSKLDLLKENGIYFSCNIVVSRLNIDYVADSVKYLIERYNAKKVSVTRVGKPINSDDTFDQYLLTKEDFIRLQNVAVELHKKYNIEIDTACPYTPCSLYTQEAFDLYAYTKACTAGKSSYGIDTDGNIKACPRDSTIYGNILTDDFKEVWESMHKWRDNSYLPNECKDCKELNRCYGGCRVDSYPFTSRLDMLDSISDPENLPIKFTKTHTSIFSKYTEDDIFTVSKKVIFVRDGDIIRVGFSHTYKYLTENSYKFLSENAEFTLKQLMDAFGIDLKTANEIVTTLITSNIVFKKN